MTALAQTNMPGRAQEDDCSDGESIATVEPKKKPKSGMVASPVDNIKMPQIWPHYNLSFGFVTAAIQFHQLSFEHFIAGETKTVLNASDPLEISGRLNLLSRLSYLKHKGYSWSNLRTLYAAIVNQIEKHEASWLSDWKYFEDMVLETALKVHGEKGVGKSSRNVCSKQWYCRDFNKPKGCSKNSPHDAQIQGRRRQVKHFCAKCWVTDQEIKEHSEASNDCPHFM